MKERLLGAFGWLFMYAVMPIVLIKFSYFQAAHATGVPGWLIALFWLSLWFGIIRARAGPHVKPKRRCKACGKDIQPPESAVVKPEYTDDGERGVLIPTPVTKEDDFFHFNCYEEMVRLKRFSEESKRITEEMRREESEGKEG